MKVIALMVIAACKSFAFADPGKGYTLTRFTIGSSKFVGSSYQNIADMFRSRVEQDMNTQFSTFKAVSVRFMDGENSVYAIKVKIDGDNSIVMVVAGGRFSPLLLGIKVLPKGVSYAGLHVEIHTYLTKNNYYTD